MGVKKIKFKIQYLSHILHWANLSDILIGSNLPLTSEPRPIKSQTMCDNCCKKNCTCDIRRVIYSIQCYMCSINN